MRWCYKRTSERSIHIFTSTLVKYWNSITRTCCPPNAVRIWGAAVKFQLDRARSTAKILENQRVCMVTIVLVYVHVYRSFLHFHLRPRGRAVPVAVWFPPAQHTTHPSGQGATTPDDSSAINHGIGDGQNRHADPVRTWLGLG